MAIKKQKYIKFFIKKSGRNHSDDFFKMSKKIGKCLKSRLFEKNYFLVAKTRNNKVCGQNTNNFYNGNKCQMPQNFKIRRNMLICVLNGF